MQIDRLDHLVLTVADINVTMAFYQKVLGMKLVTFGDGRKALQFGRSKINLHSAASPLELRARCPTPGSADLCFVVTTPVATVVEHLKQCDVPLEEGPVVRTGALGPIISVYFRDPDGNLIEVGSYGE